MFLANSHRGYTRDGQQRASGRFLILFYHNSYKWEERNNTPHVELKGQVFPVVNGEGFEIQKTCACDEAYYTLGQCPVHGAEYKRMPKEMSRVLYAHVCYVAMSQLGHFMMGKSKTLKVNKDYGKPGSAPNNLILSGTYGGDGLGCDYEDLTEESRAKLVQVPVDLAEKFWHGGGHNSAGSEAVEMRDWAIKTFRVREVSK